MSIDTDSDLDTKEIVAYWQDAQDERLEGESGLRLFRKFLDRIGYPQEKFSGCSIGNQIEDFLMDNPDAIQTLIDWAAEEYVDTPEGRETFLSELPAECENCSAAVDERGDLCAECQE